jgi:hypothetical protein
MLVFTTLGLGGGGGTTAPSTTTALAESLRPIPPRGGGDMNDVLASASETS